MKLISLYFLTVIGFFGCVGFLNFFFRNRQLDLSVLDPELLNPKP